MVLFVLLAPFFGQWSAKAARDYEIVTQKNETYAVIYNESDKVLVEKARITGSTLFIETSLYKYIDKQDATFTYIKFDTVNIK